MSLGPIPKALSMLRRRRVRTLLMGGQACILYGGTEFSRDVDLAVAARPENLDRLRKALTDLQADPVFFPPLSGEVLRRGHACHFRCMAPGMLGLRIDVMAVMRGGRPFEQLWKRREVIRLSGIGPMAVLSLEDLVAVKKTQRDKDWPMIRRMMEADIANPRRKGGSARRRFWLQECRTPELLAGLAVRYPALARRLARSRPAVSAAIEGNLRKIERCLRREEDLERAQDRRYWAPLRVELERWRTERSRRSK